VRWGTSSSRAEKAVQMKQMASTLNWRSHGGHKDITYTYIVPYAVRYTIWTVFNSKKLIGIGTSQEPTKEYNSTYSDKLLFQNILQIYFASLTREHNRTSTGSLVVCWSTPFSFSDTPLLT
jgi:hypothetical protein